MKKLFVLALVIGLDLVFNSNVSARTHHLFPTPTPHTHVCQGPDGSYLADNSVGCEHLCTLSDGSTYWAAADLACRPKVDNLF